MFFELACSVSIGNIGLVLFVVVFLQTCKTKNSTKISPITSSQYFFTFQFISTNSTPSKLCIFLTKGRSLCLSLFCSISFLVPCFVAIRRAAIFTSACSFASRSGSKD